MSRPAPCALVSEILSLWRPLDTVRSAPLAFCDRHSVRRDDLVEVDKVSPTGQEMGYFLKHRPYHRWYWKSNQAPDEPVLYVSWDPTDSGDVVSFGESKSNLGRLVAEYRPDLRRYEELYRSLHRDPELSNRESKTAGIVAGRLRDAGFEVTEQIGGHGVAAVLRNGPSTNPCVMLRADMDALPIEEETDLPYASTKRMADADGNEVPVTHACGHDVHVTSLLAVASLLCSASARWKGTLVLVFQPAEELLSGAQAMVDDGLFQNVPRPDVVLGHHAMNLRAGVVAIGDGPVMAASDSFDIQIRGRGGHGAKPQFTIDPVLIASHAVVRLQSIVAREVSPLDVAVVTCGSFHAGSAANIIADQADLKLNIRTYEPGIREKVIAAVQRIVRAECAASGAPDPVIRHTRHVPATANSAAVARRLRGEFEAHFGGGAVWEQERETASEDFSVLARAVEAPYAYWNFGVTEPEKWDEAEGCGKLDELPGVHSSKFAPAIEPSLRTAVDAMALAALSYLTVE